MYLIGGLGSSLGYHRILTHKSAEMPKWLEYSLVLLGLPAGTPIQWAGNHRAHHKFADQERDPHSPYNYGFWHSHCGWYINRTNSIICLFYALAGPIRMLIDSYIRPRASQEHLHVAKDISSDKFYEFISRPVIYMILVLSYLSFILLFPYLLFGWSGVIAASITLIIIYNLGDSIDSFAHLFGEKSGKSEARNNTILGFLAFGEGWHSNHHLNPKRARHGVKKYEFDLSFHILRFAKLIGIVNKIH